MLYNKLSLLTKFFKEEKITPSVFFIRPSMKPKIFFTIIFLMMFCPIIFLLILGIIKEKTFFSCFDFIVTIGIILAITFGLFIELLGCHIIVTENAIEVVSKIFQREDISISDIIDFKESFSLVSNKYPNSLIIRSLNKTVYINLFCYSKKDINNLKKILRREVRF